ncbi:hypothetical protein R1sor_004600 [Riccia sorocarpa]|uniref:Uncharacterized protein n=1 Tax=Riccia sorocarpa TaxID=122646 RepID=A0ABD3HNL8_9MARC
MVAANLMRDSDSPSFHPYMNPGTAADLVNEVQAAALLASELIQSLSLPRQKQEPELAPRDTKRVSILLSSSSSASQTNAVTMKDQLQRTKPMWNVENLPSLAAITSNASINPDRKENHAGAGKNSTHLTDPPSDLNYNEQVARHRANDNTCYTNIACNVDCYSTCYTNVGYYNAGVAVEYLSQA